MPALAGKKGPLSFRLYKLSAQLSSLGAIVSRPRLVDFSTSLGLALEALLSIEVFEMFLGYMESGW